MNFDDVKERLKADLQRTKERLEESSLYNTLRDRYQSLSHLNQILVNVGVALVALLIILSIPYSHLDASRDSIVQFEAQRSLVHDLLHVQKEVNETPEIPAPPAIESVKSRIESELQTGQLLPEQIKNVAVLPSIQTPDIKSSQNDGLVEVNLGQLNLKQIVDFGFSFQSISPSVKLKDLVISASAQDNHYFDVVYRLLVLKVMPEDLPLPDEKPAAGPKKKGKTR